MTNQPSNDDPLAAPPRVGGDPASASGLEDARRVAGRVLRFLARRWWVLLLVGGALAFAVRAYADSLPRTYGCTPVVLELVQEPPLNAQQVEAYDYAALMVSYTVVPTQQAVLATNAVLDPAVARLHLEADPEYAHPASRIVTTAPEHTSLISLTVEGPRPTTNADLANAVADVYQSLRRDERERRLKALSEEAERQVTSQKEVLTKAEDEVQRFRKEKGVVDVAAAEETVRERWRHLFAMLKTAETERDRGDRAEAQVLAAEKSGRDLAEVGAVRESADVRDALATLRRLEEQADRLAAELPEGSTKPELVLARSQRDAQRSRVADLVRGRAEDLKIAAREARNVAEKLAADYKATETELTRVVSLRIEFEALRGAEERARRDLEEKLESKRTFASLEARKVEPVLVRQRARPSHAVVSPRLGVIYAGGSLISLFLAIVVAFLLDLGSTRLRDPEEIHRVARAPFLGVVPLLRPSKGSSPGRLALEESDGQASEAYRILAATALLHGGAGQPPRVLLVTSPQAGEGKTTTSVGLAMAFARRGGRVLLVDADLRKPQLHEVLSTPLEPGLTTLFAQGRSVWDALRTVDVTADDHDSVRFDLLTAGVLPPNPADLLSGPRMQAFLREARTRYDAVVIDSAPVNPVSDACLVAPYVDGVMLVIREGRTHRAPLQRAVGRVRGVRAPLRGVLVNAVRSRRGEVYGGYGYGREGGDGERTPAHQRAAPGVPPDTAGGQAAAPRGRAAAEPPRGAVRVLPAKAAAPSGGDA